MGLGMSVLAAGIGFSMAVSNPFTLSVAQQIAGLPNYSGFLFHLLCFFVIYGILTLFLYRYAKKIDKYPERSLTWGLERTAAGTEAAWSKERQEGLARAVKIFVAAIVLVVAVVISGVLIPAIGSNALILMILPLTIGNIAAAKASRYSRHIGRDFLSGILGMPIITPLADLVGITRQTSVLTFCFGDGFSNIIYPTNPVLLICLGLTVVSYGKWFKWTWKLQLLILAVTTAFLYLAYGMGLGPF